MHKIKVSNIEWGVPELELPLSVDIDLGISEADYFLNGILLNIDKVEMEEQIKDYIENEYGNRENEYFSYFVLTESFDWEIIYE